MSQSTNEKVVSTFHIELSAAFKDVLDAHSIEMTKTQEAIAGYHAAQPSGQLLKAMEAANDTDAAALDIFHRPLPESLVIKAQNFKPELKQLGQWVFEGQDKKYISAAVDGDGKAYLYPVLKEKLCFGKITPIFRVGVPDYLQLEGRFNAEYWESSAINRETVNDVDYLTSIAPELQGMKPNFIGIDEYEALSKSDTPTDDDTAPVEPTFSEADIAAVFPTVTPADMQLLFIKNLADVLIQRMHSMDRFSEDDYAVGAGKFAPWDIVIGEHNRFGIVTGHNQDKRYFGAVFFYPEARGNAAKVDTCERASAFLTSMSFRIITKAELLMFREVLEACYG